MLHLQILLVGFAAMCFISAWQEHGYRQWKKKFNKQKNTFWRNHMPIPMLAEDLKQVRRYGIEKAAEMQSFDVDLFTESLIRHCQKND